MLIREKLLACGLSGTERAVADYLMEKKSGIRNMTVKEIAGEAFAAPSTLVRIAHKMGYSGWSELKEALLEEEDYLQSHFSGIDANLPFGRNDNVMTIASKIAALKKEAIEDTRSLLKHDDLQKAVQILRRATAVHVFAVSNNLLIAQEFQHYMSRIRKDVRIHSLQSELVFDAYSAEESSCGLIISYTGETSFLVRAARALKEKKIPVIMITSIGDNTISRMADCVLRITTREKMYSKIASFTNDMGITYLLDVLYSCIFALDYDRNLQWKIDLSRAVETGRSSSSDQIREETTGKWKK